MAMRACPTCKSDRCGNHAACARRKAEKAQYEASGQQRHAYFWFMWRIQWLYIGAYAYLGILSSIEDRKAREEATHAAAKQLSNQMLIFILYATSQGAAEREASVLRAHNIVEWQKQMDTHELRVLLDSLNWSMLRLRRSLVRLWGEAGWYERGPEFSLILSRVLKEGRKQMDTHGSPEIYIRTLPEDKIVLRLPYPMHILLASPGTDRLALLERYEETLSLGLDTELFYVDTHEIEASIKQGIVREAARTLKGGLS